MSRQAAVELLLSHGWSLWAGGRDTAAQLAGGSVADDGRHLACEQPLLGPAFHVHAVRARTGMFIHEHPSGDRPHDHLPAPPGSALALGGLIPHQAGITRA